MIQITLVRLNGERMTVLARPNVNGMPPLAVRLPDGRLFMQVPTGYRDGTLYEEVQVVELL